MLLTVIILVASASLLVADSPAALPAPRSFIPSSPNTQAVRKIRQLLQELENSESVGDFEGRRQYYEEHVVERRDVSLIEEQGEVNFRAWFNRLAGTFLRIACLVVLAGVMAYVSVVPPPVPPSEGFPGFSRSGRKIYNRQFAQNCGLLLATVAPSILFTSCIHDSSQFSIHDYVRVLFSSFTRGYTLCFLLEIIIATIVRSTIYHYLEPEIVKNLTPKVSIIALPWVLKDFGSAVANLSS